MTIEEKIIKMIQGDLPLAENPYEEIAKELGITEDEVIGVLKKLKEAKKLKRIGAILRHQKSGYDANAMAVFEVDQCDLKRLGEELSTNQMVSHCYERATYESWKYNLYAMTHSRSLESLESFINEFAKSHAIRNYQILYSEEELKKTSMKFF